MKKVTRNTFSKGLNRDIDKHQPQNEYMYNNENFRIITQEGQSSILIENVKGNDVLRDDTDTIVGVPLGYNIIGHHVFDNKDLVLFAVTDEIILNDLPTKSAIYLYKYDKVNKVYLSRITLYEDLNNNQLYQSLNLKNKITCVGRNETNFVRKLYWTDNTNPLRQINIMPDINPTTEEPYDGTSNTHYTNLRNKEWWSFNMIGKITNDDQIKFFDYGTGKLNVGMIQYAFRLYNKHGQMSNISQVSDLIPIFESRIINTLQLKGSQPGTITDKSIKLKLELTGYNKKYNYIQIISIHYFNNSESPDIKILEELKIPNEDSNGDIKLSFEDTGLKYIDSISSFEFKRIRTNYITKTIERKDDRLFIGNITEDYFDVDYDARAYRFRNYSNTPGDNVPRTLLYEDLDFNGLYSITNIAGLGNNINWGSVILPDEEHSCVNMFNVRLSDTTPSLEFKYKSNGMTVGGEGPNISYRFSQWTEHEYSIDDTVAMPGSFVVGLDNKLKEYQDDDTKTDYKFLLGHIKSYQRDEVYRFGIVFFDDIGRQSFTKWIGDIRIYDDLFARYNGTSMFAQPKYLVFDVNNIPTNKDGTQMDYQIVYVKRTLYDRTVLYSGMENRMDKYTIGNGELAGYNAYRFIQEVGNSGLTHDYVRELISPDLDYNNLENQTLFVRRYTGFSYISSMDLGDHTVTPVFYFNKIQKYKLDGLTHFGNVDIQDIKIIEGIPFTGYTTFEKYSGDVKQYRIDIDENNNGTLIGAIGVNGSPPSTGDELSSVINGYCYAMVTENSTLPITDTALKYSRIKSEIYPYGGYTYNDRLYNQYIPASPVNNNATLYGDTYIGMYDKTRMTVTSEFNNTTGLQECMLDIRNHKETKGLTNSVLFPVETSIVLPLLHGFQIHKHAGEIETTWIQEKGNKKLVTCYNNADTPRYFEKNLDYEDMYLYNPVYSVVSSIKEYFVKPSIFEKLVHFENRIQYSDIKYNGEVHDSWIEFRPNNMQDVDTKYGALEQLVNWKNYMFAFQYRGMCMLPINERATTTTTEGSAVVLGEGVVLPKVFNYASGSELYGLQNDNKVIATELGIYWLDTIEHKLLRFSGKTMELNFITGISNWLRNNTGENLQYYSGYDNQFKEVLFSIGSKTLVFSEIINAFQGWYTFSTDRFINTPELLSLHNSKDIWKHNVGNRTYWYSNLQNSIVELIINDESMVTKEFNNIEYMSESFAVDTKVDNYQDTFNYIQVTNDFLESDLIELLPYTKGDTIYTGGLAIPGTAPTTIKNIRRRERIWRTTIPRVNSNNVLIDNYRMRDAYVKLKLVYSNINGYRFVSHPITTSYTYSNIE